MALQRDKVVGNAEKLVARGKIEPAIREYERLLDENPNDVNTLNRIGDLWVRIERNDEAAKVFRRIADHYARDGFFLKAIAIFKKINRLDPSKLDIYAKLAELYAKQGLAMEAKSQYTVLTDYYVKHGDLESAVSIYLKIAELDPHSVNVRIKLADLYTQNNQTPEALQEYERVGRMLLKRGMAAEAVQVFRKALKIDSGNLDLTDSIVSALLDEKEHENAIQIVQSALESNRENPRLIVLLSRVHAARGDDNAARESLEQGLNSNPSDFGIRQNLAEMHLRDGDADQAVELIGPVIAVAHDRVEGRNAVDLLERIVMMRPDHSGALEKLVAAYRRLDDDASAITAMTRLGDAYISRREYDQAEVIFRDLVVRDPENSQHRDRLAEIAQETGSAGPDVTAAREELSSAAFAPEPAVEFDFADGLPDEIREEPDAVETTAPPDAGLSPAPQENEELEEEILELEFPPEDEAPEPAPSVDAAASLEKDEKEAAELFEFVTEHVTEADVFAKYGLYDKAIEHLQSVLLKAPRHRPAYERLLNIFINEGKARQVGETANRYVALLRLEGDLELAEEVERSIWNRGFTTGDARAADQDAASAFEPELLEEPTILPEELAPIEMPVDEDTAPDIPEPHGDSVAASDTAEPPGTLDVLSTVADSPEIEIEFIEEPEEEITLESEEEPQPTVANEVSAIEQDVVAEIEAPEEAPLEPEPIPPASEPPAIVEQDPFEESTIASYEDDYATSPSSEDLGELDFYIEQELLEEAGNKLETLSAQFPMHADILTRQEKLQAARARISGATRAHEDVSEVDRPDVAHPTILSHEDVEQELISALSTDAADDLQVPGDAGTNEADLFAAEDDFFDLAAEIGDDLAADEAGLADIGDDEQSLEQIFREFKKGVEQQLDSEDYDTHYNLGIAYKEMGLIDEAIGEFQLASKDPNRAIDGCSMLGLCFLEKGMPQLAIKWYTKGLEMPEISEEEHMGLLYDLGAAYLEVGDIDAAHKAFVEVYGINSKYRDIAGRIKQLEDVRRAT